MARVSGPLFSLSAKGTIGKAFTFLTWRGIPVAREWFRPRNPQSTKQVNVRTALTLSVAKWQELPQAQKDAYIDGAGGQQYSGFNLAIRRMMDAYVDQLGTDTLPVSLTNVGNYPSDVITWSDV